MQVTPVIRGGNRATIAASSIKKSHLWSFFKTYQLSTNMRAVTDPSFSQWLLDIGDGNVALPAHPKTQYSIQIPKEHICENIETEIFGESFTQCDSVRLSKSAILCPKNDHVNIVNENVLRKLIGSEEKTLYSIDSARNDQNEEDAGVQSRFPLEFLNQLKPNGFPPHKLTLKTGCVVMLLRNLNIRKGLCNGTRMIVKRIGVNVLEVEVITGILTGTRHLIPRISLNTSKDAALPFNLVRHQFPVQLSYAMTINKSQGQTFERVGLYLFESCFGHGQFYTGCSRSTGGIGLKIKVIETHRQGKSNGEDEVYVTDNVVYSEILE